MTYKVHHGDCRDAMKTMASNSVDSIVTDPPYGLSFMGKGWDHGVPGVEFWEEAIRVAKPGAHLLAFGGTRTFHRLAVAIEDAGWEIRDTVMWVYGSGFPKSHNVSKAIDKDAGAERDPILDADGNQVWTSQKQGKKSMFDGGKERPDTYPARQWNGWGTALKPAWEPIIVARKPLDGTVAENVLRYGTGAMNIDGCRVGTDTVKTNGGDKFPNIYGTYKPTKESEHTGRWPANLIHDGSDEVVEAFPNQEARFFYCAKASRADRDEGLDGFEVRDLVRQGLAGEHNNPKYGNHHPTVKPTSLMAYLCNLVTRPGGVILDPFMGSGSTGKAAIRNGFDFIGIEQDVEYVKIAEARIDMGLLL